MGSDTDPHNVMAMGVVFLVLCPVVVGLRFAMRFHQKARIGIDDWLIVPALLMIMGCSVDLIVGVSLGVFGYKTPPPPNVADPDDAANYNFTVVEQLEWAFFLMQITAMGLIKLSFVFFFRRIFVTGHKRAIFNYVSIAVISIIVLWTASFFFWFLLSCSNKFSARWTTVNTLHHVCSTDIESDLALAISDFLTDVLIMFLPIPMVLRLQMKTSRKFAVIGVFALGAVAMIASIIRLALFVYITGVASGRIVDPTADNNLLTTSSLYWSMLESGLALIACCMPVLQSVARVRMVQSVFDSVRRFSALRSYGSASRSRSRSHSRPRDLDRKPSAAKAWPPSPSSHEADPSASQVHFVPNGGDIAFETFAVHEARAGEDREAHGRGEIHVEHTVDLVHAR